MNKKFTGITGEQEMGKLLEEYRYSSSATCNSSFGFFQDVYRDENGQYHTAIVPDTLNGGAEHFRGEIKEITESEAKRLMYS